MHIHHGCPNRLMTSEQFSRLQKMIHRFFPPLHAAIEFVFGEAIDEDISFLAERSERVCDVRCRRAVGVRFEPDL
jgi:hypothetical protein